MNNIHGYEIEVEKNNYIFIKHYPLFYKQEKKIFTAIQFVAIVELLNNKFLFDEEAINKLKSKIFIL